MSVNIKRSLWEKLSFIERIDFYPYHKGLEISWSFVGDKTLSKSEEEKLEDDLGDLQSGRFLQSGKHSPPAKPKSAPQAPPTGPLTLNTSANPLYD